MTPIVIIIFDDFSFLHISIAPEELFCTFRQDVAEHIIHLHLLLYTLLLNHDRLLFRGWDELLDRTTRRGLLLSGRRCTSTVLLFLRLLVLNEEEGGRDCVL